LACLVFFTDGYKVQTCPLFFQLQPIPHLSRIWKVKPNKWTQNKAVFVDTVV